MATQRRIRDIIDRELILRKNNVSYRQEYGVMPSENLTNEIDGFGNEYSVFKTKFVIKNIIYVTVNGVTQVEGIHYEIINDNTIKFKGKLLDGRTVAVGYHFVAGSYTTSDIAPYIEVFKVEPNSGGAGTLQFSYKILERNGTNIFWGIYKNGESTPVISVAGYPMQGDSMESSIGDPNLQYELTAIEAAEWSGKDLNFTFIVTYDDRDDDDIKNEKVMKTAAYAVDVVRLNDISISIDGDTVTTPTNSDVRTITYNITTRGYPEFTWWLKDVTEDIILDEGDASNAPNNRAMQVYNNFYYDSVSKVYALFIREGIHGSERSVSDTINVQMVMANDATEVFDIDAAAGEIVVIDFLMDKIPSITIIDNTGELVSAEAIFTGEHQVSLTFNIAFVGKLILN